MESPDPDFTQSLEEALNLLVNFTVPLYYDDEYGRPILHGTGFFVRVEGAHCLVTAAHVLDTAYERGLFYYATPSTIRSLAGVSTRTGPPATRAQDIIDVGVLRLTEDSVPPYPAVAKFPMSLDYLRSRYLPRAGRSYAMVGFPATKSKVNRANATVLAAPHVFRCDPISDEEYGKFGFDPREHVLFHLNLKVGYALDGTHQHFPKPQGMSGAPIFVMYSEKANDEERVFPVVALATTYRSKQKLLIGTDIGYVLEALSKVL